MCSHLLVALIAGDVPHDSFWPSKVKKETSSKSLVNKYRLRQTDFSCHNGKRPVVSYYTCHSFRRQDCKESVELSRQISFNQRLFRSVISKFPMEYSPNDHITADEQFSGADR